MITTELRVGNYVTDPEHGNQLVEILVLDKNDPNNCRVDEGGYAYQVDLRKLNPIHLSPDVLGKCGFEKTHNSNEYWSFYRLKNGWHVSLAHHTEPIVGVREGFVYYSGDFVEIEHLHRLQNLYNSLTKNELT